MRDESPYLFSLLWGATFRLLHLSFKSCSRSSYFAPAGGPFSHTQGNGRNMKPFTCPNPCFPQVGIQIPMAIRDSIGEEKMRLQHTPQRSAPAYRLARFHIERSDDSGNVTLTYLSNIEYFKASLAAYTYILDKIGWQQSDASS